jgi:hypothetical protein
MLITQVFVKIASRDVVFAVANVALGKKLDEFIQNAIRENFWIREWRIKNKYNLNKSINQMQEFLQFIT